MNVIPFDATLELYQQQAKAVFANLQSGDEAVQWRFKWMHPRFRGKHVSEVKSASLTLEDAKLLIAREYYFEDWNALAEFTQAVQHEGEVKWLEQAVEAVIAGDVASLRSMLQTHPELVKAHSVRNHHATLLHYLGANGIESYRQKTPANAVEIMKLLLEAGTEPDVLADMYDQKCTTMSMLVSSSHPHEAGLQTALAETLLDHGAALEGPGSEWSSAVLTALLFGYLDTAKALAKRGAKVEHLPIAAGLGQVEETKRLLPTADSLARHQALALAAQLGHLEIVKLLLDAGEDPNRYNPEGFHSHATPLHHAALAGHLDVVKLLVERGARLDICDTLYDSAPLGWAKHGKQAATVAYLDNYLQS
ncbi:MAG: ankyrin repeat domain-containing protein [Planctomycetia bacterium]|nr:ankyrin repeat domain-containing protein [Planctomycetia bacterium]